MLKILVASAALTLMALPADAQGNRTGSVTATGQTKPPSRDASPTSQNPANQRTKNDASQDKISKGICIGCEPK